MPGERADVVLVTGVSGAGKTVALGALEDGGYFAVQNLPPSLLTTLVEELLSEGFKRIAVSFDMRLAGQFYMLPAATRALSNEGITTRVIILEARDDTLVRRFSETRRHHPLIDKLGVTLEQALHQEREHLMPLLDVATRVDTSGLSAHALRSWLREWTAPERDGQSMSLVFESFGYKYGVPTDADLVFDARVLPNPHYETGLAEKTGKDQAVENFLGPIQEVQRFTSDIEAYVRKWFSSYRNDNRASLTVAIGCTGGKHRSVYIVEQLVKRFSPQIPSVARHRQLD